MSLCFEEYSWGFSDFYEGLLGFYDELVGGLLGLVENLKDALLNIGDKLGELSLSSLFDRGYWFKANWVKLIWEEGRLANLRRLLIGILFICSL